MKSWFKSNSLLYLPLILIKIWIFLQNGELNLRGGIRELSLQGDLRAKNLIDLFEKYKVKRIINTLITENSLNLKR